MSVHQDARRLGSVAGLAAILVAIGVAVQPRQALSHHGFNALKAEDGTDAFQIITGTVRVMRILNPHGALIVDVPDGSGETEGWLLELSPASQLAREGWSDEMVSPGDRISAAVGLSVTENRGRLRALLIHGKAEGEPDELYVAYGIRGNTPVMQRLRERLPVCGTIDASYQRTECFSLDAEATAAIEAEFGGHMAYVLP